MNRVGTALFIFGKIQFLLIPEKEFFQELKCDGFTSFMDFGLDVTLCFESCDKNRKFINSCHDEFVLLAIVE